MASWEDGRVKEIGQVINTPSGAAIKVGHWTEWSQRGENVKVGYYQDGKKVDKWFIFDLVGSAYDPMGYEEWSNGTLINTVWLKTSGNKLIAVPAPAPLACP